MDRSLSLALLSLCCDSGFLWWTGQERRMRSGMEGTIKEVLSWGRRWRRG
jgi:hypothetical protein